MTEEDRAFIDESDIPSDIFMNPKMENVILKSGATKETLPSRTTIPPEDDSMRGYLYPIRIAPHIGSRHVNLLLTKKDEVSHYSRIKNLDGFLQAQYPKTGHGHFHCYPCLHSFYAKKREKSREHMRIYKSQTPQCVNF